jgi:uncharacterized protein YneF (UPF0154 family)
MNNENNMSSFEIYWTKKRNKGMLKYSIIDGALGLGGTFYIIYSVFLLVFYNPSKIQLLILCILSIFGGLFLGLIKWYYYEKLFKRQNKNKDPKISDEEIELTLKKNR